MSIEAMIWVKNHAPTTNSTEMCILYALADRANDDGTGCWPYYETLADEARCSLPTVKRHIKKLEERGLIVRGDQSQVSRYPAHVRPVVWDLNMTLRRDAERVKKETKNKQCQNDTAQKSGINDDKERYQTEQGEVSTVTKRGITGDTHNLHTTPQQPLSNPPAHQSADADAPRVDDIASEFDQWWKVVPRKKAKGDARNAFKAARKIASLDELIDGMTRSIRRWEAEGRDASKIPYPATWLRAESWDDEDDHWVTRDRSQQNNNSLDAWLGTQSARDDQRALNFPSDAPFGNDIIEHDEGVNPWNL